MIYRVIGLMSGSSLDGLDIAFVHLQENAGRWTFELVATACYPYSETWKQQLKSATGLPALDYQLLHTAYGQWLGEQVNEFIATRELHYKVQLIASHGHTTFHVPARKMTAQLGDGAALAAATGINVVSDLRAIDIALGGQGAPIVPIGEKLLFGDYSFYLNLGGIANLSFKNGEQFTAFDVCPANRVLNMLANEAGKEYDAGGAMAAQGAINLSLLDELNALPYYSDPYPKSLANNFGTEVVYPILKKSGCGIADALRTFTEHIAMQIARAVAGLLTDTAGPAEAKIFTTGGGALNTFLVARINEQLKPSAMEITVPDENIIQYKEALIMALIGVLRWREESNVMASVTGASRNSIGGAVWIGQEA